MKKKKSWKERVVFGLIMAVLIVLAIIELVPFLWMFMSGFKSNAELLLEPFKLPEEWLASNYRRAWTNGIGGYLLNSVFVTAISTVMTLVFSIMAAYPIARIRFKYQKASLMFVLSGLMRGCKIKCVSLRRESSKLTHFVSFTECDKITGKD